ncbi:MAG: phenylalanine--tRNA ligase subunit beta [Zoogloeaceae bacterium]|jgi:phenylalanyl-tRNA synthetase beta chain|nr:phenylalanine--tRNA ligase subunit beta [Zoogloeaceae bacterium]
MKFSESWLRTLVNPPVSSEELARLLTMAGLEVEAREPVAPAFQNVVAAQVLEVAGHPDADRLHVCRVDTGAEAPRQIVCGAPNVAVGLKVPCALPGAVLPGDLRIQAAKLRGVDSAGMLCSARELGISSDASGLFVLPPETPTGEDIRRCLDLDDILFTLKLTPNRADCLSLLGIAREVAALTGASITLPSVPSVTVCGAARRFVALDAPQACPRYCGRVIEAVDARAPTPEWMRRRLERCGIRSISALVDVTNYVLLELGQPLHAFDYARLSGNLHVRMARPGETLTLLNEQQVEFTADVLVIADEARALAMAGIMGGTASGVTLETRDVFLESAFFAPEAIAGRARRYNFSSDAAHRYERGVDFENCRLALERASALVLEICGGKVGPITESVAKLPERAPVRLRPARVERVLGAPIATQEIRAILERQALAFTERDDAFLVTPPSYRFDLEIEADLIEEVARLHGYENISAAPVQGRLAMRDETETARPAFRVRQLLADRGFQEIISYAFVPEVWETDFAANHDPVRLANPIASQLAVLRSSLFGGLVATLSTNLKRKQGRVRLFEQGRCFLRDKNAGNTSMVQGYQQPLRLAALASGTAMPEGWGHDGRAVDFFDLKGELEALLAPAELTFEQATHPALHPGQAANIYREGEWIGVIGALHPKWMRKYELSSAPVLFEIAFEAATRARLPTYSEPSRFQAATRDRAFVLDAHIPAQEILAGMRAHAPALVTGIQLFDVYQGEGIPAGKKSLAFRIVMQDTGRTLLDAEIESAIKQITAYLEQRHDARLRT